MTGPNFERLWPSITALILVAFWYFTGKPFPESGDGLFGTSATVAAVFASFLGVAEAIILGLKGSPVYEALRRHGYTVSLFAYLRNGILASTFFAAMSVLGFFISKTEKVYGVSLFQVFQFAWIFSAGLSLTTYSRSTSILFKLLRQP